jgi:hypothetical protein
MRYYPYDFMASILYHKIFRDAVDETSDWGVLDARDIPEWALLRQKECELIGKACMSANVEKVLAHSGNHCNPDFIVNVRDNRINLPEARMPKVMVVDSPTGPNHFYNLWLAAHHDPNDIDPDYDAFLKKEIYTDEYLTRAHKKSNAHFDLWVKWGSPKLAEFKIAFRNLWVKHDCPNKVDWDIIIEAEARSDGDFAKEYMGSWETKDEDG